MCGLSIPRDTESTHRGGDGKKPTLAVPFLADALKKPLSTTVLLWGNFPPLALQ